VHQKNVKDDLDFKDCIRNPKKEQVEIPAFSFNVNRDSSIEEQILTLNTSEQMFNLPHLKEMNSKKKIT
jgi:hypothetical protein